MYERKTREEKIRNTKIPSYYNITPLLLLLLFS